MDEKPRPSVVPSSLDFQLERFQGVAAVPETGVGVLAGCSGEESLARQEPGDKDGGTDVVDYQQGRAAVGDCTVLTTEYSVTDAWLY